MTEYSTQPGGTSAGAATAGGTHAAPSGTAESVSDRSLGSLVSALTGDLSTLVRQEMTLAKTELREEAKKAGKGAGMLGGAAFCGWMFAIFLSTTLMWLLDKAMDLTVAALIVALIWGIAAAILGLAGRRKLQELQPKPQQTIDSIKEDAEWLKAQKK